jgi:hypothetical protein
MIEPLRVELEVRFVPTGETSCRVEIVQSGWDRLVAEGLAWREANTRGWSGVLPSFGRTATETSTGEEQ